MNAERITARRLRLGLVAAATLLTSACAAGQLAQTADENSTLDGINKSVGNMDLRALAVQSPTDNAYSPGSDAALKLVLVNSGSQSDTLTSISSPQIVGWGSFSTLDQAQQVLAAGAVANQAAGADSVPKGAQQVAVAPDTRVSYGTPDAKQALLIKGVKKALYPGNTITLTFTFARAGSISVAVPVQLTGQPGTAKVPAPPGTSPAG